MSSLIFCINYSHIYAHLSRNNGQTWFPYTCKIIKGDLSVHTFSPPYTVNVYALFYLLHFYLFSKLCLLCFPIVVV